MRNEVFADFNSLLLEEKVGGGLRRSDEVESRKFLQVFFLFIPSDFLAKITSPCNKGRLGKTVISSNSE